jgi:hypothetical protein
MLFAALLPSAAPAQFEEPEGPPSKGVQLGEPSVLRYKAGVIVEAVTGTCRSLYITVPVPTEWPEQQLKVVDEDYSSGVTRVKFRADQQGVRQMLVFIPVLPAGRTAKALITYEVTCRPILPPKDPTIFQVPKKLDRKLTRYLATSIYIEPRSPRIRAAVKEVTADKATVWEQVAAIYDYVRTHVEHRTVKDRKGAASALRDGHAGNHDLTALFVAMCRAHKIPARTVWVTGHCYAEFYLHDDEGKGHWIPCQVAGTPQFGENSTLRTIMQKGDCFEVPEKREQLPYVREFVNGKGSKPRVTFVRESPGK